MGYSAAEGSTVRSSYKVAELIRVWSILSLPLRGRFLSRKEKMRVKMTKQQPTSYRFIRSALCFKRGRGRSLDSSSSVKDRVNR